MSSEKASVTIAPPTTIEVVKSDSDASINSLPTLLSDRTMESWMEMDDELKTESAYEKLVHSFAHRDKILDHICEGKSKSYVAMLRKNEELVRREAFKIFDEERRSANPTEAKSERFRPTLIETMASTILFECHCTFRACIVFLCYCTAHLSIYEVIASNIYENSKGVASYNTYFLKVILLALVMSRLCGGLWFFLSESRYLATKFDLHNRLRLQQWDAKLLLWFKSHPMIQFAVDHLSIYMALVGVSYFIGRFMGMFEIRETLLTTLPSAQYGIKTLVTERLQLTPFFINSTDACMNEPFCANEEFRRSLFRQDELHVWNHASINSFMGLLGDTTVTLVTRATFTTYYFVLSTGAIGLMTWMGFQFQ